LSLVSSTIVLPAFLTLFTKSNFIITLIPAIFTFFWTFAQFFSSHFTSHFGQKKIPLVFIKTSYALQWLVLALLTLFVITPEKPATLILFFIFYALFAFLGGFAIPTWASFIYKIIIPSVRGRFYALRVFVGTSFAIFGSFMVKDLLKRYTYPLNFALIFLFAFSIMLFAIIFLSISREPYLNTEERKESFKKYFKGLKKTLQKDKDFVWLIISLIIRSFGVVITGSALFSAYAINYLNVELKSIGNFLFVVMSMRLIGSLLMGYLCDLKGPKVVQIISRFFEMASAFFIIFLHNILGIYIGFAFLGLASSSMMVSYHNLIMAMAPKNKVDLYTGLINGIRAPSLAIAPLIGGILADLVSFKFVFIMNFLAIFFSVFILIFKIKVKNI